MSILHEYRVTHLSGTPSEMGYAMGSKLGEQLEANIRRCLTLRPQPENKLDYDPLRAGAIDSRLICRLYFSIKKRTKIPRFGC
jgi:hypothetical protein